MQEGSKEKKSEYDTSRMAGVHVLLDLKEIWKIWEFDSKTEFLEHVSKPMWFDESTSGEKEVEQVVEAESMTEWHGEPLVSGFKAAAVQFATLHVSCAYAIQAMKADLNSPQAWAYACEAKRWLGILQGTISGRGMEQAITASKFSTLGLDKRHAENRAMKASVMEWCDANFFKFKSMDKAAEAIAGKEVPVSFRTARSWVADWKRLRSTGKV